MIHHMRKILKKSSKITGARTVARFLVITMHMNQIQLKAIMKKCRDLPVILHGHWSYKENC